VIQAVRQTTLLQALSQAGGIADDAGNAIYIQRAIPSSSTESVLAPQDLNAAGNSNPGASPRVPENPEANSKPRENSNPEVGSKASPENGNNAHTFTVNISDLLESGDSRFNILVLGGDIISVPRAGIIYVVGAVNHPGGFVIQNDRDRMTAMKMLSIAGGTTGTARVKNSVILRKNPDTGKRDEVPLDLSRVMKLKSDDVTLEAGDMLFVPDSSRKKALHRAGDIAIQMSTGVAMVGATRF
jgi:polysaccharide export outer membrane protein